MHMDPKTKPQLPPAEEPALCESPAVFLQEQLTGAVAPQAGRTAAEILAERQAETASGGDSPAFVP
jgi:hypothetical protein